MIFSVKDSLRQAVEAASGGLCTVMYTKKGQPVFMRRVPRFNLEDLDPVFGSGPHPAFVVNGETKSEIWISMFRARLSNGELVSVPGVAASAMTLVNAINYARANGPGFHLMTRAEYMAALLQAWRAAGKTDPPVRGNTRYGRSHEAPWETAVRVDGGSPGTPTSPWENAVTLQGSGPLSWRHDGTPWGIYGLIGDHFLWHAGVRVNYGRIEVIPNNDAALGDLPYFDDGVWQSITPTGALAGPATSGRLFFKKDPNKSYTDDGVAQNVGPAVLGTTQDTFPTGWNETTPSQDYVSNSTYSLNLESGLTPPPILYALGLVPIPGVTKGAFLETARLAGKNYLVNRARAESYSTGLFGLGFFISTNFANGYVAYVL